MFDKIKRRRAGGPPARRREPVRSVTPYLADMAVQADSFHAMTGATFVVADFTMAYQTSPGGVSIPGVVLFLGPEQTIDFADPSTNGLAIARASCPLW